MDDMNQKPQQLNIELSEEVAQGIYSNLAVITHSSSEFVVDFVRIMPGIPKANVKSGSNPMMPPLSFGGPTAQA